MEANILADGEVINPLITWNGFIVDGHNRYRILMKHKEMPYRTFEKDFSDRYAVLAWICKNQLGRRNLTPAQRKYLIGKQYKAEKAMHGGDRKSESAKSSYQNDNLIFEEKTSDRIARENGIGRATVIRSETYAEGIDAAEEVLPGIRQEILSGEIHPLDKDITAIAHTDGEERAALAAKLREPRMSSRADNRGCAALSKNGDEDTDIQSEPFRPSKASIQKISEAMASRPDRSVAAMSTAFIIDELASALDSMIFRWDFCLRENSREASDRECRRQIQELVQKGISYLKLYRGGKKRDEK